MVSAQTRKCGLIQCGRRHLGPPRDRETIGVEEGHSLARVSLENTAGVLKYTLMGTTQKNQGTGQEGFVSRKYEGSLVFKSALLHWLKAPQLHKTVYIYTLRWSYRTIILQKPLVLLTWTERTKKIRAQRYSL